MKAGRAAVHRDRQPCAIAMHRRRQSAAVIRTSRRARPSHRASRFPLVHAAFDRLALGTRRRTGWGATQRLRPRRGGIPDGRALRGRTSPRAGRSARRRDLRIRTRAPAASRPRRRDPPRHAARGRRGDGKHGSAAAVTATATVRAGLRGPALARALIALLGPDKVLIKSEDLLLYEYDGGVDTAGPDAVVIPSSTQDVAKLARFCHDNKVPIVPRGAGTGLSGGAVPVEGGVVLSFARMTRIHELDAASLRAVVEP